MLTATDENYAIVSIERVQVLADISRCCHSNETRSPTANPPNSTQLEGTPSPTILPSYIRVHAVVWECSEGQTDRYTHIHTDGREQCTFRLGYTSYEM